MVIVINCLSCVLWMLFVHQAEACASVRAMVAQPTSVYGCRRLAFPAPTSILSCRLCLAGH